MITPVVSVIIPTYNYGAFVGKAIESVLDQTFADLEVVVVDDGSTDNTAESVAAFTDERVRYVYQENGGLPAARNTGIRASRGEILAFLDADDRYLPGKLVRHVAFLEQHPEVGLTYGGRYVVDSLNRSLRVHLATDSVRLKDLVLGYPFAPSDVVMRRSWAERVRCFDESYVANSEDLNFHIRLALAGCRFAGIPQAFACRTIHTGRTFGNIALKMKTYLRALDTAFADPHCPQDVLALRDESYGEHYLVWGYQAGVQGERELSQHYLTQAVRLLPHLLEDRCQLLGHYFIHASIRDGGDHEEALQVLFRNLPSELEAIRPGLPTLIAHGYLLRGLRELLWQRMERARPLLQQAIERAAMLDKALLQRFSDEVTSYAMVADDEPAVETWDRLRPYVERFGGGKQLRRLFGRVAINQAFHVYEAQRYDEVPQLVLRAIINNPRYLANRGVLSITARSLLRPSR